VRKANVDVDSLLNEIPRPSMKNTLPFQIPIGLYHMVIGTPSAIKGSVNLVAEEVKKELEKKRIAKEEEELAKKLEVERLQQKEERKEGMRRRKEQQSKLHEKTDEELAAYSATIIRHTKGNEEIKTKIPISGGLWTDDDLIELTRLTKKYPGGTVDRWETISDMMNRNVSEVTFMAYKLKDNVYQKPGETEKLVENINKEINKKIKTKAADVEPAAEKGWSQEQQKALEAAIQKYPKGGSEDRWVKIANSVPGKTKEDCQHRYKYLVELVKKQKQAKEQEEKAEEPEKIEPEPEIEQEEPEEAEKDVSGGKKRNKRKDKKKNFDYYAEDSEEDSE
jgi:DnaJ homolog subfamily C member 1